MTHDPTSAGIVTLGTGSGQRRLLEGLRPRTPHVTAIVGVTDNGGSSARIRHAMEIPQPGDTRNCLGALAENDLMRKLFDYRFSEGELAGMNLGNYIIAALARLEGDFGLAIERANELLETRGRVLPATTTSTHVCAELSTGGKIVGEWEIIRRSPRARIHRIYLEHPAPVYPPSAAAVRAAKLVVIGPGSLRTGIAPLLLCRGMSNAIDESGAPVVYICNLMTQPGQTDGFTARDHVAEIERYLGFPVDHIVINTAPVPAELRAHFARLESEPVVDDLESDVRVMRGDYLQPDSIDSLQRHTRPDNVFFLYHDPVKLADVLESLLA